VTGDFRRGRIHAQVLAGQLKSVAIIELDFEYAALLVQIDVHGSGHNHLE
jgi:hypothetical protein